MKLEYMIIAEIQKKNSMVWRTKNDRPTNTRTINVLDTIITEETWKS